MTEQDKIGEGIDRIIILWENEDTRTGGHMTYELRKRILNYLHSQGVVIKVDKKVIPLHLGYTTLGLNGREFSKRLEEAGYVAVEPILIKEEI